MMYKNVKPLNVFSRGEHRLRIEEPRHARASTKGNYQNKENLKPALMYCDAMCEWCMASHYCKVACTWQEDEDGVWWTNCNEGHVLLEGSPYENLMTYCCYCGQPLLESPYTEPLDDEELEND